MKIKPIILSGGSGIRLWPISRTNSPKQFIDIFNKNTNLFEDTINRIDSSIFKQPIVISNKEHRYHVLNSIRKSKKIIDKIQIGYLSLKVLFLV